MLCKQLTEKNPGAYYSGPNYSRQEAQHYGVLMFPQALMMVMSPSHFRSLVDSSTRSEKTEAHHQGVFRTSLIKTFIKGKVCRFYKSVGSTYIHHWRGTRTRADPLLQHIPLSSTLSQV